MVKSFSPKIALISVDFPVENPPIKANLTPCFSNLLLTTAIDCCSLIDNSLGISKNEYLLSKVLR